MERENNKLKFTLIWSSCICVLLLMVVLGISSSAKGTLAADACTCPYGGSLITTFKCFGDKFDVGQASVITGNAKDGKCQLKDAESGTYTCAYTATCPSSGGSTESDDAYVDGDGNCTNATSCPAGQYLVEDSGCKTCKTCPSGKVCYGGTSQPQSCSSGSVPNENADTCVQVKQCYCSGVNGGGESCKYMTSSDAEEIGAVLTNDSSKCSSNDTKNTCYQCNSPNSVYYDSSKSSAPSFCQSGWHQYELSSGSSCPSSVYYFVNFYVDGDKVHTFKCTSVEQEGSNWKCKQATNSGGYGLSGWYGDSKCATESVDVAEYVVGGANYYRCKSTPTTPPADDKKEPTSPSNSSSKPSSSDPSDEEVSSKPADDNVSSNPQTGDIAIFVVWVISIAAIVYSIWYFKQVREN